MKVAGLASAYLFAFVVARFFGAQAWGEFSLALSVIMIGAIVGTAGMDTAIVKITAGLDGSQPISSWYRTALITVLTLSTFSSMLIFFLSEWIAGTLFDNFALTSTFKIAAFAVLPLSIINLNAGILQGLEKINRYNFIRFVSRHITALLSLLVLVLIWTNNHIVIIAYLSGLFMVAAITVYWLIQENIRPFGFTGKQNKPKSYIQLFKLSLPLMFAASLVFLNGWIDTIMVGTFLSEQDVGVYNIALKLSGIILLVWTSVNVVVTPKFSNLYSQNRKNELRKLIQQSSTLIFFCTIPIFLFLVLFPNLILSMFGEEFVRGRYVLLILCIGNLAGAWAGSEGYFMQMTSSQVAFQNITLASSILSFILNYLLIPVYGIEGAAIATSISIFFWKWSGVLYIKYRYDILTAYFPFLNSSKSS